MVNLARGLIAACEDKRLLNFTLWPRQRELLEAVESEDDRIHVWCIGRRSGKTTMAAAVCLWDCLLRPELDAMVLPGQTRCAVGIATNVSQSRLIMQAARSIVERSRALSSLIDGQTEDEVRFLLPSGARTALRAFPCSSRGGRGWAISTLVFDETAHFTSETDGDRTAEAVWQSMVPSTAQFGSLGRIIVSSTPYGTTGLFHDLWQRARAGEIPEAVAQHASTAEMNPTIDPKFLEMEQKRDPDSFRSEYLAEFTGSGDAFLDFSRIDLSRGAPVAQPEQASVWVAGLDPAFSKDPFGVALVGRTAEGQMVVGPVLALRAEGNFAGPVDEVAEVCKEYGAVACADQFSAAAVIERLRGHHALQARIHTMTAQSKTAIFQSLRTHLYDGSLILPDNPELIGELRRLRVKYSSGQAAVVNPRVGPSHGDRAQALAMAVHELSTSMVRTSAPVFEKRESRYGSWGNIGGGLAWGVNERGR